VLKPKIGDKVKRVGDGLYVSLEEHPLGCIRTVRETHYDGSLVFFDLFAEGKRYQFGGYMKGSTAANSDWELVDNLNMKLEDYV
jgi:hypothetical protein